MGEVTDLDGAQVIDAIGLEPPFDRWVARLETVQLPPEPLAPPDPDELGALLERLGLAGADVASALATMPHPERSPAWWWLLERCHARLVADVGVPSAPLGWWPQLPIELGEAARTFWIHVVASVVSRTRAWHLARQVPDAISWATLADLGRHVAIHRRQHGIAGIDAPWWLVLHLRGELYECGRLQFHLQHVGGGVDLPLLDPSDPRADRPGWRAEDPALGIHIPEAGPLDAAACDAAFDLARSFFPACFPAPDRRLGLCTSWLLDEQLASYLAPSSNIVSFQRRFELARGSNDGDGDVISFVFRRAEAAPDLDTLPRSTTLERAVVDHLRSGGHWKVRTGWLEL